MLSHETRKDITVVDEITSHQANKCMYLLLGLDFKNCCL